MKKTAKITLCALSAAVAACLTLAAYFPYVTYAAPAVAGLVLLIPLVETNIRWAFSSFAVSVLPVMLFAEVEAKLMYVFFFGWYPIVKALIERIDKRWIEWIIKFIVFNLAIIFIYGFLSKIVDISLEDMGSLGKYGAIILLVLANITFLFYDVAIEKMASFYVIRLHPHIKKIFK